MTGLLNPKSSEVLRHHSIWLKFFLNDGVFLNPKSPEKKTKKKILHDFRRVPRSANGIFFMRYVSSLGLSPKNPFFVVGREVLSSKNRGKPREKSGAPLS